MKIKFVLLFVYCWFGLTAQIKTLSWNLENFGKSKSDSAIQFIANTLKDYDVVAVQEVVAGEGGAQAVARLADELNRKGAKWDYTISDPTTGTPNKSERYAYLWKTARVTLKGKAWLERKYQKEMDREPYLATFAYEGKEVTLVTFHAITKSKQPERELRYFKDMVLEYPMLDLIFMGDFNCPQSHPIFKLLRGIGYESAFKGAKTSLKKECKRGQCLASEFDNIWYKKGILSVLNAKVLPFYTYFKDLKSARAVSDHIPVGLEFFLLR
jgi:endonuclease/exonuclease/phosphatase family metal-dependent hydrolase